jgi:predicted nucleic-acid-binding protein
MIRLDTNLLVRIVLADDALQTTQALDLLQACDKAGEAIAVSLSVILELEWVLRSAAKLKKPEVSVVFKRLLEIALLRIENEAALEQALYLYDGEGAKADFAECLFSAQYQRMGCRVMASFDEKVQHMPFVNRPDAVMASN